MLHYRNRSTTITSDICKICIYHFSFFCGIKKNYLIIFHYTLLCVLADACAPFGFGFAESSLLSKLLRHISPSAGGFPHLSSALPTSRMSLRD